MAEGYNKRNLKRKNEFIELAWNTAYLSRVKEMPELKSILIKDFKPARQQTDEEMMAMARLLNAAFGGVEVVI